MESNRERAHVYVSGNVQGVFFRDSTRQRAEELGLAGWVKNRPDGRVEAVFEGPSDEVRQMVDWCENGPSQADVDDVEVEYSEAEGGSEADAEGFEVR